MDCIEFNKNIPAFINDELRDAELNDFLMHFHNCEKCRDEMEINYIVNEGVQLLDDDLEDYNISKAFHKSMKDYDRYMLFKKRMLRFMYIIRTIVFWCVIAVILIYLRDILF